MVNYRAPASEVSSVANIVWQTPIEMYWSCHTFFVDFPWQPDFVQALYNQFTEYIYSTRPVCQILSHNSVLM